MMRPSLQFPRSILRHLWAPEWAACRHTSRWRTIALSKLAALAVQAGAFIPCMLSSPVPVSDLVVPVLAVRLLGPDFH